jgi:hypothetical protein
MYLSNKPRPFLSPATYEALSTVIGLVGILSLSFFLLSL